MKLNKRKNYKNQEYQKSKDKEKDEKEKEESPNRINVNNNDNINNKIIQNEIKSEEEEEEIDKPQPPSPKNKDNDKPNKKNIFFEMIEVEYDSIKYRLFLYINEDNNLIIELIPRDGYLPYSYKHIFDEKKFYSIDNIFKELKTIEKIGQKIINLFKKDKVLVGKSKRENIFYLILKVTIIDEDKDIFIPLNKNDNIQVCTINYLLKEAEKLKNDFSEYKDETEDIIKQQLDEINGLKKSNKIYMKIIKKIKSEYNKKSQKNKKLHESLSEYDDDEDNEDVGEGNENIIINKEKNKDKEDRDNNSDLNDDDINKISEIIIDQNEYYTNIKSKIAKMEKELNDLTKNYRCDINSKYKILHLSFNQVKPFVFISFELTNTGINPLTNKFDDIFCDLEGINQDFISFYDQNEKYISLHEPLLTNQKIIICKKIILNKPSINRKYDFCLSIYTLNHGRISEQPIKFQVCIREKNEQKNFITFLQDKKWGFDCKNKNKKIIFEYTQGLEKVENNSMEKINMTRLNILNEIDYEIKNSNVKIRKYIYDEKTGKAFEKEENDEENDEIDKIDKYFNNLELSMSIVINKDDVDNIIKKIHDKFKNSIYLHRLKLEEIICQCIGDFDKISRSIRSII